MLDRFYSVSRPRLFLDYREVTRIVLARTVAVRHVDDEWLVPFDYDPSTGVLAIALEIVCPHEHLTFDINPLSADSLTDEEQVVEQLVGLFCALPKIKDQNAHKVLCTTSLCTPVSICILDPEGSRWRGLCAKARAKIDGSVCAMHRRKNKILLVKSAKSLLGCVPKWLLPPKRDKG